MMSLTDRLELKMELNDYINNHAWIMDVQNLPFALMNESCHLLYANKALHQLFNTANTLPTIDQLNKLFRGVKKTVQTSIADNKSKTINKTVKDNTVDQLIPYKINIMPVTYKGKCEGALLYIETDIRLLVDYFVEEKMSLSDKVLTLTHKYKNTLNLVTALFDNSPVGMMILDKKNRIMQMNTMGASILDVKASSVVRMLSHRFYTKSNDKKTLS